jgi:hypothetical protein
MSKRLKILSLFNRPHFWLLPVISLTSIVPITLTQRQATRTENLSNSEVIALPPSTDNSPLVDQKSQVSQEIEKPEVKSAIAETDSLLKTPTPIDSIPSPASETKENPTTKAETKVSESVTSPSKPQNSSTLAAAKTRQQQAATVAVPQSQRKTPSGPTPPLPGSQSTQAPKIQQSESYIPPRLEIKVALVRNQNAINLGTSTGGYIFDANGKLIQNVQANQGFLVQANGNSLSLDGKNLPPLFWVQPSSKGLLYVGDRWYRGRLLIASQGSDLLVINYVDLEQYLYSVVGSEMHPTANMEALKAQAVAARSYALVHMIRPASKWYHLGATPRWQAYNGLSKEYNTSIKAVELTAGQILSYKGGVVESLYAATDDIVRRAHGGRGMSQTGAYKLADSGYNYEQILANYYPGVQLARLELN